MSEKQRPAWVAEDIPDEVLSSLSLSLWLELSRAGPGKMPDKEGCALIAANVLNAVGWIPASSPDQENAG